jgi:hypothetical protein
MHSSYWNGKRGGGGGRPAGGSVLLKGLETYVKWMMSRCRRTRILSCETEHHTKSALHKSVLLPWQQQRIRAKKSEISFLRTQNSLHFQFTLTFLILNSMNERDNLRVTSFILSRNTRQIMIQLILKHDRHVYRFYFPLPARTVMKLWAAVQFSRVLRDVWF